MYFFGTRWNGNNNTTTTPVKDGNSRVEGGYNVNDQVSATKSNRTYNKSSKADMNMSPSELSQLLNLPKYLRNGVRMWTVRCVTALDVQSLNDALLWAVEERWEKYDAK